ncbi:hypothetical protein FSP39_017983 [Pinctada imbricata]|uniref:G-protein coupled receptors family 1 profile domain-containing protein n=1 Tax=Pinctada imbricata TaxID=66713 RepID=A0AA89BUE5_PINIB|nr:hypothetical protein FSP39_017983 [Pinctada imbricata]
MENDTNITCVDYCGYDDERWYKEILQFVFPKPQEWFIIVLFIIVFILGIVGNFLVCYAVWKNSHLRTVTNYFLVNLSTADLMVILLCLPPTLIHDALESWFLGLAMCKIVAYFQNVSVLVSVLTLTAIAIERYTAICHPLSHKISRKKTVLIIIFIWIVSLSSAVPEILFVTIVLDPVIPPHIPLLRSCRSYVEREQFIYQMVLVCVFFVTPLYLMGFAYLRIALCLWKSTKNGVVTTGGSSNRAAAMQCKTRKKTAKMLIVVVIVFFICYLPVHLLNILRYVKVIDKSMDYIMKTLALLSHWLCYFNSSINPIIYNFMSGKYICSVRIFLY